MLSPSLLSSAVLLSIISRVSLATNITTTAKALYFIDNKEQNNVHAVSIGPDGLPSGASVIPTGQSGTSMVFGDTRTPAIFAALDSTGCVRVYKNWLFNVNTVSGTITMFQINPDSPTELTPVGQAVDTQGDFPNSMAISPELNQLCVGNTGPRSGISCFSISPNGLTPVSSFISIPLGQTMPPSAIPEGPLGNGSYPLLTSISFNPNSSSLIASISGAPTFGFPGSIAIYPVVNGTVFDNPRYNYPASINFPFAVAQLPGTSMVVLADAAIGSSIVETAFTEKQVSITQTVVPILGTIASCWAVWSDYTQTVFVADAAVNQFAEIDPFAPRLSIVASYIKPNNTQPGNLDMVAVGPKVYALSPGLPSGSAAIVVLDTSMGKSNAQVAETYMIPGGENGNLVFVQGMAWY